MYLINKNMKNISINNEPLKLDIGQKYYIIDALYLSDIKDAVLETNVLSTDIRTEVFPFTNTPFAQYKSSKNIFFVSQIIKIDYDDVTVDDFSFFSTDTGLIIFVLEDILMDFLQVFSYGDLVNSENELVNQKYWEELTSKFNVTDIGLIMASINSETDFDGSGTYKII